MNVDFSPRHMRAVRLAGAGDPLLTWTPQKVAGAAVAGMLALGGVILWQRSRRRRRRR